MLIVNGRGLKGLTVLEEAVLCSFLPHHQSRGEETTRKEPKFEGRSSLATTEELHSYMQETDKHSPSHVLRPLIDAFDHTNDFSESHALPQRRHRDLHAAEHMQHTTGLLESNEITHSDTQKGKYVRGPRPSS
jgi:hypothetical protein